MPTLSPSEAATWLTLLAAFSAGLLVLSAVVLPVVLVRLPADHLMHPPQRLPGPRGLAIRIGRNVVAIVLALAGVAMLLLPGQGILTLLAALLLSTVPGKRRVAVRCLGWPPLKRGVDRLRARAGAPPLQLPVDPRGPAR